MENAENMENMENNKEGSRRKLMEHPAMTDRQMMWKKQKES
jgi:hypothetical protein